MSERWVVRWETHSLLGFVPPLVTYEFYRWRWWAKFDLITRPTAVGIACMTHGILLGRESVS